MHGAPIPGGRLRLCFLGGCEVEVKPEGWRATFGVKCDCGWNPAVHASPVCRPDHLVEQGPNLPRPQAGLGRKGTSRGWIVGKGPDVNKEKLQCESLKEQAFRQSIGSLLNRGRPGMPWGLRLLTWAGLGMECPPHSDPTFSRCHSPGVHHRRMVALCCRLEKKDNPSSEAMDNDSLISPRTGTTEDGRLRTRPGMPSSAVQLPTAQSPGNKRG